MNEQQPPSDGWPMSYVLELLMGTMEDLKKIRYPDSVGPDSPESSPPEPRQQT